MQVSEVVWPECPVIGKPNHNYSPRPQFEALVKETAISPKIWRYNGMGSNFI
jgi:hypothetical protein